MADIDLTPESVDRAANGLNATYNAVSSGNNYHFVNDGRTILHAVKSTATDMIVTLTTPETGPDATAIADLPATVPASDQKGIFLGPFPKEDWNNDDGEVVFSVDQTGEVAVLKIP